MDGNWEHPQKHSSPIEIIEFNNTTDDNDEHS
jgi:hypothetical protein